MDVNIVQFDIAWCNPSLNISRVKSLCKASPPQPGSLLVLPEMFATGFCMDADIAATAEQEIVDFVAAMAKEYQCYIIAGVVVDNFNCAMCVSPDGEEVGYYAKQKLFTFSGEDKVFTPGSETVVFDIAGLKVAPLVCYDLRFPELFRRAVGKGAEAFVVIASWPGPRREHWLTLLRARAIEDQACVIAANRTGSDPNTVYAGDSCIIDAFGNMQCGLGDSEGVLRGAVDIQSLRRWRAEFPALKDSDFFD